MIREIRLRVLKMVSGNAGVLNIRVHNLQGFRRPVQRGFYGKSERPLIS